jgi:hypothetical protein
MKVNVKLVLRDFAGEPIKTGAGKDATLAYIFTEALLNNSSEDLKLSGEEKLKRYQLAKAINQQDEIDFTIEDLALIQSLVTKGFGPMVVGQVHELINF